MAIIGNIRKRSGLVIGVIGVSLLAFVLTDALSSKYGLFGRQDTTVGVIGGHKIDLNEYDSKIKQLEENYKARMGGAEVTDEIRDMIQESVWNEYVDQYVTKKEYEKLDLNVGGEELTWLEFKQVRPNPIISQAFTDPNTGKTRQDVSDSFGNLDINKVLMLRQSLEEGSADEQQWIQVIDERVISDAVSRKYKIYLEKSFHFNSLELKDMFRNESNTVTAKITGQNYYAIPDSSIKVTESEKQDYLKKNAKKFEQKESRKLEFVLFDLSPSVDDSINTLNEITELKAKFVKSTNDSLFMVANGEAPLDSLFKPHGAFTAKEEDSLFTGDTGTVFGPFYERGVYSIAKLIATKSDTNTYYKASHILLRPATPTPEDTVASMKQAEELLAKIKSGEQSLEDMAALFSKDNQSANNRGDRGWFDKMMVEEDFWKAVTKTPVGQYAIAKSDAGIHILKVTSGPSNKQIRAAVISKKIEVGVTTDRDVFSKAQEFAGKSQTEETFTKNIESMKLVKNIANEVKPGDKTVPGMKEARELIRWAYHDDRKVGEISEPLTIGEGKKYAVARLVAKREEGTARLEDVDKEVEEAVIKEKKAAKIKERMEAAMKNANGNIQAVAAEMKLIVHEVKDQTFANNSVAYVGNDPIMVGYLTGAEKGKLNGPVKTNSGVFAFVVENVNAPKIPDMKDLGMYADRLRGEIGPQVEGRLSEALKKAAKIKDQRYKFY